MKIAYRCWILPLVILSCACSLSPNEHSALQSLEIRIPPQSRLQSLTAAPASVDGFECLGVQVTGPEIVGAASDLDCLTPGMPSPGIIAGFVPATTGGTLRVVVPAGPARVIQVFGVKTSGACPGNISSVRGDLHGNTALEDAYEIGRTTADIYADSEISIQSNYLSAANARPMFCERTNGASTSVGGINLEVPIELLDDGVESQATPKVFERSRTSLDTADYDGTVEYAFEVVASNSDSSNPHVLSLVNGASVSVASISVPANTIQSTRFKVAFVPTAGSNTYRIQTEGTSSIGQLKAYMGRILVRQTGATKTRIYYPLASAAYDHTTPMEDSSSGYFDTSTSSAYSQPNPIRYSIWKKDLSVLSELAGATPWTLEAVLMSSSGSASARAMLHRTDGTPVSASEVTTNATAVTLVSTSFSDSSANFDDQQPFELRISSTSSFPVYAYKAGLWVRLQNLSKALVLYRLSRLVSYTGSTAVQNTNQRTEVRHSLFSNPVPFLELVGSTSCGAGQHYVSFESHGTDDVGTASGLNHGAKELTSVKQRLAFSDVSAAGHEGYRFIGSFYGCSGVSLDVSQTSYGIKASK